MDAPFPGGWGTRLWYRDLAGTKRGRARPLQGLEPLAGEATGTGAFDQQGHVVRPRWDLPLFALDQLVGLGRQGAALMLELDLYPAVGDPLALLGVDRLEAGLGQLEQRAPDICGRVRRDVGDPGAPADRPAQEGEPASFEASRAEIRGRRAEPVHLAHVAPVCEQQHAQSAAPMRETASSISGSLTVSGGRSLTVSGPVAWVTSRCSSRSRRAKPDPSSAANASIRPRPRTSSPRPRRPAASASPFLPTPARKSASSTTSRTALAAAAITGPPANVEP